MADGRVKLSSHAILLILIIHLLILSARDAQCYKLAYHYSRLHVEASGTTTEPVKAFTLLPSFSTVPNKRTSRAFMTSCVAFDMSGICSFQLNKLSGDVHPNPCPSWTGIKFPCSECQKSVHAILCAACDQWFHTRCIGKGKLACLQILFGKPSP